MVQASGSALAARSVMNSMPNRFPPPGPPCAREPRAPGAADSRVCVPGAGVCPRAAHRSVLDVVHEKPMVLMEYAINCCSMVTVRLRMGAHGAPGDGSE